VVAETTETRDGSDDWGSDDWGSDDSGSKMPRFIISATQPDTDLRDSPDESQH
jgi:hypothetical protein